VDEEDAVKIFQGTKPDITPAQLLAALIAGVPIVATLLSSFGVYDLSAEQQDALTKTIQWGGVLAVALFGADAGLRAARNSASAKVEAAHLLVPSAPPEVPAAAPYQPVMEPQDDLHGAARANLDPDLPDDEEEFGGAAPAPPAAPADDEQDLSGPYADFDSALPSDEEEFAEGGSDHDAGPESRIRPAPPQEAVQ
jgi:hypothetical protein